MSIALKGRIVLVGCGKMGGAMLEGWLKAGAGDDKTEIVVIADFYDRAAIYNRDRFLSTNANAITWGGFDARSPFFPGGIGPFRLIPRLFFSANSPPPHSAPNVATSPYYVSVFSPALNNGKGFLNGTLAGLDGDYVLYNFQSVMPAISSADRQSF